MVGLIPLFAVEILRDEVIDQLPGFRKRLEWFLQYRQDLSQHIAYVNACPRESRKGTYLLAIPARDRLERVLAYLLDEEEFLAPYGIRSLSKKHASEPFELCYQDRKMSVSYVPGESDSYMFGGNSNWRGPIWFPVNFMIIESLRRYHEFDGEHLMVECPTGSGNRMHLGQVADELAARLTRLFLPDQNGRRPCHGDDPRFMDDPHFHELPLFYEHFHPVTGRGLGASHQTGWTGLVLECLTRVAQARVGATAE